MEYTKFIYDSYQINCITSLLEEKGFETGSNYFFPKNGSDEDWVIRADDIQNLFKELNIDYTPDYYLNTEKYKERFNFLNIKIEIKNKKTIDIVIVNEKEKIVWKKSTSLMKKLIEENVVFKNICRYKSNRVLFFEIFKNFFRNNCRDFDYSFKNFMKEFQKGIADDNAS